MTDILTIIGLVLVASGLAYGFHRLMHGVTRPSKPRVEPPTETRGVAPRGPDIRADFVVHDDLAKSLEMDGYTRGWDDGFKSGLQHRATDR
jgi:hypothetical protein